MRAASTRWPAAFALGASLLGLSLAGSSTFDYAQHLDRQVHGIHCSYIPGLGAAETADNACRIALFSPYSAVLRDRYWGGVPIALFAMGAFAFFAAFALYLLLAGRNAPRRATQFLAIAGWTPLAASAFMAFLSATRLGHFCKTCVGMYIASFLLAVASIAAAVLDKREERRLSVTAPAAPTGGVSPTIVDDALSSPTPRASGSFLLLPGWLFALGVFAATPALVYAASVPSYTTNIGSCGKLVQPTEATGSLLRITPVGATTPATLFVDPLCPTCKAFHQRLEAEGVLEKLDLTLVLFPLDNTCNWMLDRAVHPGSCLVSKAVLCSGHDKAMSALEWAYDKQDEILETAKAEGGDARVRELLKARFPDLGACIDAKETGLKLDKMLRYIVNNQLQVSTPQLFLGERRLCDEDTDIGLSYTLRKLAPELAAK